MQSFRKFFQFNLKSLTIHLSITIILVQETIFFHPVDHKGLPSVFPAYPLAILLSILNLAATVILLNI